jgi:hypothetical protein
MVTEERVNRPANSSDVECFQNLLAKWNPGLVVFFQLNHNNFNRLITGVDVGGHRAGWVCAEPVSFAGFLDTSLSGPVLFDDFHSSTGRRYDYAWMFMTVHGERRVWKNDGIPNLNVVVSEQWTSLRLHGLGMHFEINRRREEVRLRRGISTLNAFAILLSFDVFA